jgi:predicted metalloendopeptidase
MAIHPDAQTDRAVRKLAHFYASCMDTVAIERQGAMPLARELAAISVIQTAGQVRQYLISMHTRGLNEVFNFGSTQDAKKSTEVIGAIQQGGLGLPDRDYYLNNDSESVALRGAYVTHVINSLILTGESPLAADSDAQRIMALETAMANASFTRVQLRDPDLTYNRKTPAQLAALTPHFNWRTYFAAQKIPGIAAINVMQPKFIVAADSLLDAAPVASWRAYFRWHLVDATAPTLSQAFVNEDFTFHQKMTGAKALLPRYRRCTMAADNVMGEALGKAYVQGYFKPAAKVRALKMLKNLKAALRERIATRTWMSDSTRTQAYAKLNAFMDKIGYPDKWKDYAALDIKSGRSYYDNTWATLDFINRDDIQKIGKPLDRTRWGMSPPTVNASYDPSMNELAFPAGILQPPFFDPNADDAVNYGGMGAVMGHEMTHGFDDQGAQYDSHGNLRQWFTNADLQHFHERTKSVETQFDNYTVLDSVHVNGKLTLGENIADMGGVLIAYTAFEKSLQGKPRPPKIDGFTPEQRFFLGWAQMWRTNIRPELERLRVRTDSHSPQIWRTNGPLSNLPEFARAWGCKEGDMMVRPPALRADIW